jgi:hypothetical protein
MSSGAAGTLTKNSTGTGLLLKACYCFGGCISKTVGCTPRQPWLPKESHSLNQALRVFVCRQRAG